MNWKKWAEGLLAAVLGGIGTTVSAWGLDPADFNLDHGLPKLWRMAVTGAIIGVIGYLKQPAPKADQ